MTSAASLNREYIVSLLEKSDKAVCRALVVLNNRQTADEQNQEITKYRNLQGFRPCHARMGTSMATFYSERGFLSKKQIAWWRHVTPSGKMRIEVYASQLLNIAKEKNND
jgi:hypothetical protein